MLIQLRVIEAPHPNCAHCPGPRSRLSRPRVWPHVLAPASIHFIHTLPMTYLTDVNVALHDRVVGSLMNTDGFHAQEGRLEHGLWTTESLVSDGDHLRKERKI